MPTQIEYIEMWRTDCRWDITKLAEENVRVGPLHHKYATYLMLEQTKYEEMSAHLEALTGEKREFYTRGTDEVWRAKGWEEWSGGKVLKTDLGFIIPQDKHVLDATIKLGAQKAKVKFIDNILSEIHERRWLIKNAIAAREFEAGK